jgi:exodeoxyribonuclease VII large subunit
MSGPETPALAPRIWQVGALCRAVADALDARFNPVAVRGEISGFSRAASGHCYFSIKDDTGQIRCAMFRRAASLLDFVPRDGELVEVRGGWASMRRGVTCN